MKKMLMIAACGLLALSACAYSSTVIASPREAASCKRQGYTPGTEPFDACVLQMREVYIQRARIRSMEPAS